MCQEVGAVKFKPPPNLTEKYMKKIITILLSLTFIISVLTGCSPNGGPSTGGGDKVTVKFMQSGSVVKEISVEKGRRVKASDLPEITTSNVNFKFEWAIDVSKPIEEDINVEMSKYSSGVKVSLYKGNEYQVTGWDENLFSKMPKITYLPSYYNGGLVTNISSKAFHWSSGDGATYVPSYTLEEVVLPEYLVSIGPEAFMACKNLKKINFPTTLRTISSAAFKSCPLKDFRLNDGLEIIGAEAFHPRCEVLYVPEGLEVIDIETFSSTYIKAMILPKSLKEVRKGGIWPVDSSDGRTKDPVLKKIYYRGDWNDWLDLYENISEEQTSAAVNVEGMVDIIAPEDGRERRSSKDAVDWATIYIYSEEEPEFNYDHVENKYWHYDAQGNIVEWPDPVE